MKQILQTDPVFSNLTIPLSEKELEKLERSLLMEGCLEPVTVWDGVILDGHKRYEFCSYEEIPFEVVEIDFADQKDALIWVCEQRMHDAPKKKLIYKYLVGTWCLIMKPVYSKKYRKTAGMEYRDESGRFRV